MTYTGMSELGVGIHQVAIDPSTGELLETPRWLWAGTGGKFPEGPHLYRIGEWWYLLIAEGGTERGHAVTLARGRSARGPFEGNPANPILTARGTGRPVQSTGHADLIERPDGSWAMVYHGVRARGSSPEWHVLGRETFATEVTWADGWPALGPPIEPDASGVVRAELTGPDWPVDWVAASNFPSDLARWVDGAWVLERDDLAAGGGEESGWEATAYVGRRQEHLYARVTARLSSTGTGTLSWRIDARHAIEVEVGAGRARAVWAVGDRRLALGHAPADGIVTVRIEARPADGPAFSTAVGPDLLVAGLEIDGSFVELGRIDGRYVSTEVAGGMTGRLVGVAAPAGRTTIHSFRYEGGDDRGTLGW